MMAAMLKSVALPLSPFMGIPSSEHSYKLSPSVFNQFSPESKSAPRFYRFFTFDKIHNPLTPDGKDLPLCPFLKSAFSHKQARVLITNRLY